MKTAYPTGTDVSTALVAAGVISTMPTEQDKLLMLDTFAGDAKIAWEDATGWHPFLADTATSSRTFYPQGPNKGEDLYGTRMGGDRVMRLHDGLLSCTSLTIGISPSDAGTLLTEHDDYYLEPVEAAIKHRPYEHIRFAARMWGLPESVEIVGRWGFWSEVPEDAWLAILYRGMMSAIDMVAAGMTGGATQIKLGESTFVFSDKGAFTAQKTAWTAQWRSMVLKYRRENLGDSL